MEDCADLLADIEAEAPAGLEDVRAAGVADDLGEGEVVGELLHEIEPERAAHRMESAPGRSRSEEGVGSLRRVVNDNYFSPSGDNYNSPAWRV